MCIEKDQLVKNGGKNKYIGFIILFSVYFKGLRSSVIQVVVDRSVSEGAE